MSTHTLDDWIALASSTSPRGRAFINGDYAAESNLKQVWLECGGKSANIVFADSENLETAADKACQGIFFNHGEVCSANSRLLVERDIKDEFLSLVIECAGRIRPGNPLDPASNLGAMAGKVHTDRVMAAIAAGRDDATLVLGGSRVSVGTSDFFVEPTVFNDVPNGGPDRAGRGLRPGPGRDRIRHRGRVAGRLHVGTLSVNTVDAMSNQTPFGGVKQSGFGRDLSLHALNQYTALKTTWISY